MLMIAKTAGMNDDRRWAVVNEFIEMHGLSNSETDVHELSHFNPFSLSRLV